MKKSDFDGMVEGLTQAAAHARGDDVPGARVHDCIDIDGDMTRATLEQAQWTPKTEPTSGDDPRQLDRIRALLREKWDPIGFGPLLPADEYDTFAMQVWGRLKRGEPTGEIAAYLTWVAGEYIGVETDPARERAVAEAAAKIMGLQDR